MGKYLFAIDNEPYEVDIQEIVGGRAKVSVNGEVVSIDIRQQSAPQAVAVVPPVAAATAPVAPAPSPTPAAPAPAPEKKAPSAAAGSAKAKVSAPLPGIVRNINVRIGDKVKFGDTVLMLEAMKMENNINATESGTVIDICCTSGDAVKEGDTLIVIGE